VVDVGHNLAAVALDETGSALAAWGEDRLSLCAVDGSIRRRSVALGSQRVRRLQVTESVVAVVADGESLMLRVWSKQDLTPGGTGPQWSGVETDGLLAGGARAVLWGRQGRDLDFSAGSPWLRICKLGDSVAETWRGDGLDVAVNGVVYPVRDGHLGVYSVDTLVELVERGDGWIEHGRQAWNGFAQCVSSGDGSHVLALGSEGSEEDDSTYLRVVRLDGAMTVAYAATEEIAEPTSLAVSNDSSATAAYVSADLVLHILTLTGGDLAHASVKLG
jgi:hypothetical protein